MSKIVVDRVNRNAGSNQIGSQQVADFEVLIIQAVGVTTVIVRLGVLFHLYTRILLLFQIGSTFFKESSVRKGSSVAMEVLNAGADLPIVDVNGARFCARPDKFSSLFPSGLVY